jgi:hypothetical protein
MDSAFRSSPHGPRGSGQREEAGVRGVHAALQGKLGQDVELRRSASGKDWARLSGGVGEGDDRQGGEE